MMEGFKQLGDNFPERILKMAEENSRARNEKMLVDANTNAKTVENQSFAIRCDFNFKVFGQIATVFITIAIIGIAFFSLLKGNETTTIISLLLAFSTILPSIIKGITGK